MWLVADSFPRLLLRLGDAVPADLGDPLPQAWQVAWGGHALRQGFNGFWNSNQFWPLKDTLAFSDALVGFSPSGLIGSGVHDAIVRYDILFLGTWVLAAVATYLLARELDLPPAAAAVAGVAFAFAPWRTAQAMHLHVLATGGIPLTFFFLLRGYRKELPVLVLVGWLVAAWQLSLGFSIGIPFLYLLLACGLVALVRREPRERLGASRHVLAATVVGTLILVAVAFLMSRPYLRVVDALPEAARTPAMLQHFSPGIRQFFVASEWNVIWGGLTAGIRAPLRGAVNETSLFPGLAIVLLALWGTGFSGWSRRRRGIALAGVAIASLLSLGFQASGVQALLPYRLLYEFAPGWEGIRTPGRLAVYISLGLALLAGCGAARVLSACRRRNQSTFVIVLVSVCIPAVVVAEGSPVRVPVVEVPIGQVGAPAAESPILLLPASPASNRRYLLWSTEEFAPMLNGQSSVSPREFRVLLRSIRSFPSEQSFAYLRAAGVRTVVIHPELLGDRRDPGSFTWRGRESQLTAVPPLLPPGVSRTRNHGLIVYRITAPE